MNKVFVKSSDDGREEIVHKQLAERVKEEIHNLLDTCATCNVSYINEAKTPSAFTCFYAFDGDKTLYFISLKRSAHIKCLAIKPECNIAVWRPPISWDADLYGANVRAKLNSPVQGDDATLLRAYLNRFPEAVEHLSSGFVAEWGDSALYSLHMIEGDLISEESFGEETYHFEF
ncbi:MAG: hypothetical protein WDZ84_01475 [Rhodovibrionaceae bacterium]